MTVKKAAKHKREHGGYRRDPLLSCLSRLILEPYTIKPHLPATSGSGAVDSLAISGALIRETLSLAGAGSKLTAARRGSIQTPVLSHR
jgi:hypothetical protein